MKAWWIHWVKRLWFIPCSLVSQFICLIHAPHINPVTPKFKKYILPGGWLGEGWLYARWIGRGCSYLMRTLYCLGFAGRRAAIRYSLNYMACIPMPKLDGFPGTACSEGRSRLAQSPFLLRTETLGMWAKNWIKTINSHDYSALPLSSPPPPSSPPSLPLRATDMGRRWPVCFAGAPRAGKVRRYWSPVARLSSLDSSRAQYGSLTGQYPDVVLGLASAEQPITLPTISQEQLLDD